MSMSEGLVEGNEVAKTEDMEEEDIFEDFAKYHPSMDTKVPGVRFFKEISRCSIVTIEVDEPFREVKLFELHGIDLGPLVVEDPEYYPYPGCIFVSRVSNTTVIVTS